jgi:hypothetical protein
MQATEQIPPTFFGSVQLPSSGEFISNKNICSLQHYSKTVTVQFSFFWVNPRRLCVTGRRFGTLYRFHLHRQVDEEWLGTATHRRGSHGLPTLSDHRQFLHGRFWNQSHRNCYTQACLLV